MITCSHCNTENTDEAKFCMACGAALVEEAEPQEPTAGQEPAPSYEPQQEREETDYTPPPAYAPARPAKDRSIALLLEILPGLIGILGIGWIYGGNSTRGIIWLVGYLIWFVIGWIIAPFTLFFSLICTIPINLALITVSAITLNKYTKEHPEIFG